ncbi:MAG TPA: 6-phosphogluconolactonase [bacterium]
MSLRFEIAPDADALAVKAVERLEALAHTSIRERGRFILSLSGGSTPKAVYALWGSKSTLDWAKVVLLFGDERCVPPQHADSNYKMVDETLLASLRVKPTVYRMEGEQVDIAAAARLYENTVRDLLGHDGKLDVALMGIGEDGHTASLFPRQPALREGAKLCTRGAAPNGQPRLTLTVPVFRNARELVFLAAGKEKAAVMNRIMQGRLDPESAPAQFFLRDPRLNVTLMLDRAAAVNVKVA